MPNSTERREALLKALTALGDWRPTLGDPQGLVEVVRDVEDQLLQSLSREQTRAYLEARQDLMREYADEID